MKNKVIENQSSILHFTINGEKFDWRNEFITGFQVRELGRIPDDHAIFLSIKKPWEDEPIEDSTKINLARPERENFYSKTKAIKIQLIVNGRPKDWQKEQINFEEVVTLAFGTFENGVSRIYTVTYDRGPKDNPEGSMVKGDQISVKNKMIFNVTATDKS